MTMTTMMRAGAGGDLHVDGLVVEELLVRR